MSAAPDFRNRPGTDDAWRERLHRYAEEGNLAALTQHCTPEDVDYRDRVGWTAMHEAAYSSAPMAPHCLRYLAEKGFDLESRTSLGRTPLHLAVVQGNLANVRELLRLGANLGALDNEGHTPASDVYVCAATPTGKGQGVMDQMRATIEACLADRAMNEVVKAAPENGLHRLGL